MVRSLPRLLFSGKRATVSTIALGTLFTLPSAVHAQEGVLSPKGPLPYRNSEPINALFLAPSAASAQTLGSGRSRFDVNIDLVTNFLTLQQTPNNIVQRYNLDFEDQRFNFGYARGIGDGQELGIRVPYIARNGGILDGFIEGWHKLFHFNNFGRENYPQGRTIFQVNNRAGQSVVDSNNGYQGIGDVVLEWRKSISAVPDSETTTRRVSLTARALVKLPTGSHSRLIGSGATDTGLGIIIGARPLRNMAVHANISQVWLGKSRIDNLESRRTLTHTLIGVEYLLDGRTSFNIQTDDNAAPFQSGIVYPDRPARAFTFGAWRQTSRNQSVYLSMSENDFGALARNAPDFVISLGTRWRR